jgi:LmbE family N-acetylglucosaminyl deacetylase
MAVSADGAVVVVSPHLDDAVLSASAQLIRPGARLVTGCAGLPPAASPLGDWDRLTGAADAEQRVRERWLEDDAAAAVLGVTDVVRLDFPDGQHLAGPRTDAVEIVSALRTCLDAATEIWAPAGIGCHPDHLATRAAVVAAATDTPGVPVHFYADVPYSLRYGWPPSVAGEPPSSPYLDVEEWLRAELAEAGLSPADLDRQVHVLDDEARRRKVKAMACYRTQLPALDYAGALANGDPAIVGFEVSWSRR